MENGYSVCFNEWALDKSIKNELGLLLIVSSLCAEKGYCYASNEYLAGLFDVPEETISRKLKLLKEKRYIEIDYEYRGFEVINRSIRLTKMLMDGYQKRQPTVNKNVKDNIIRLNNTSINKIFRKPTIQDIQEYCNERNNGINAEAFYDFYESKGWCVGKNKMKDWKACVRTWEQRNKKESGELPSWWNKSYERKEDEYDKLAEQYTRGYLDS